MLRFDNDYYQEVIRKHHYDPMDFNPNSTFYGINENDKFCNFINQVDSKLLQIHLEEDKSR